MFLSKRNTYTYIVHIKRVFSAPFVILCLCKQVNVFVQCICVSSAVHGFIHLNEEVIFLLLPPPCVVHYTLIHLHQFTLSAANAVEARGKMKIPDKLQQYLPSNREVVKQKSLILFNKLIRTKNPASLQEDHHGGLTEGKNREAGLQVSQKSIYQRITIKLQFMYGTFLQIDKKDLIQKGYIYIHIILTHSTERTANHVWYILRHGVMIMN